jgi:hypothetical protein
MSHLATGAPAPAEYIELQLCREFRCLPSQLRREHIHDVTNILTMMSAEEKTRRVRNHGK